MFAQWLVVAMGDQSIARYHVRNYLWIFVNAQIENPSFDSQTKETLTLKAAKFGPDGPVLIFRIKEHIIFIAHKHSCFEF